MRPGGRGLDIAAPDKHKKGNSFLYSLLRSAAETSFQRVLSVGPHTPIKKGMGICTESTGREDDILA